MAVVAIVAVLGVYYGLRTFASRKPFTGPTYTVKKEKLKVSIVERGSLESAKNGDIVCNVRSGQKGSTIASTIKWIVDPGVEVKKGDKLVELDSSGFIETLKTQNITVDSAKSAWIKADEDYRIQEGTNETDIAEKSNMYQLAVIDLQKYVEGDYVQSLKDVLGRIETAKSDMANWADRASWSNRMYKKGLVSKVQADADDSRLDGARIALEKVDEEKRVLVEYTKKRTMQDLQSKVTEYKGKFETAKALAKAKLIQANAERQSKDSIYKQELSKKQEIEGEIAKCTILAPQDGLVVYYVPEQVRGGGGSQQSIVAQGEPVREGQKIMQIPDLSKMLVNVRVHEAMVSYLHNEYDPGDRSSWQSAQIRVDAYPSRVLRGHVKSVDTVASQQDFFASDVKVYKTMVSIDEPIEGLRPGMSAEVTITADESPNEVLVVPIQAVVGTISSGAHRSVFVLDAKGQPEMKEIVVGMSNQRSVEVRSGLKEGEQVVLNPTPLLPEDSDLKPARSKSKAADDDSGNHEEGKKTKKGKKKSEGGTPGTPKGKGPDLVGAPPVVGGAPGAPMGPPGGSDKFQAMNEKFRSSTPAQRREMINNIPDPAVRERVLQKIRDQGLEVAN